MWHPAASSGPSKGDGLDYTGVKVDATIPLVMVVVGTHFSHVCFLWFSGGNPNPLNC